MKKICLLFIINTSFIFSQNKIQVELKNLFTGSENLFAVNGLMMNSFKNKKYGSYFWIYKNKIWSEGYGGLTYMPTKNLQLGVGIGIEDADDPLRLSSMIWVGDKKWYVLSLLEDGGSGKWHQINALYRLNKYIQFGLMEEKYTGFGPRIELTAPNLPIALWFSLLRMGNNQNSYITLKILL